MDWSFGHYSVSFWQVVLIANQYFLYWPARERKKLQCYSLKNLIHCGVFPWSFSGVAFSLWRSSSPERSILLEPCRVDRGHIIMSFGADNFGLVEGAWGEFEFRKIQPQDWERVMEHIKRNFLRDEPTCKLLGYSDDFGEDFAALAHKMLGDDLSFLVEHRESGDIAGVRVTFRHYRSLSFDDIPLTSYAGKALMRLVDILEKMSNLYDAFQVPEYAEFFVASCDAKYRRMGITTEMYRRNLEFLKAEGFKLVKSIFTSPYTRAAVSKFGFVEVCRLDYHEFIDDEGQLVFNPDELSEEHFAAVMVKLL